MLRRQAPSIRDQQTLEQSPRSKPPAGGPDPPPNRSSMVPPLSEVVTGFWVDSSGSWTTVEPIGVIPPRPNGFDACCGAGSGSSNTVSGLWLSNRLPIGSGWGGGCGLITSASGLG